MISSADVEYLIPDATKQPAQRPKKGQKKYYSGWKKKHTLKTQYIVGPDGSVYAVSGTYPGSVHDFAVYKDQKNRDRFFGILKKGDSGYQGIKKYDRSAEIPFKKPGGGVLTDRQKAYNRSLSKDRIKVENVIRETKIFKVLSDTYRNRHKNHSIKTDIISGIVNIKMEERNIKKAA